MPLIYKPYQANIANKAGQKLYYQTIYLHIMISKVSAYIL